jgi:hypothetical protein
LRTARPPWTPPPPRISTQYDRAFTAASLASSRTRGGSCLGVPLRSPSVVAVPLPLLRSVPPLVLRGFFNPAPSAKAHRLYACIAQPRPCLALALVTPLSSCSACTRFGYPTNRLTPCYTPRGSLTPSPSIAPHSPHLRPLSFALPVLTPPPTAPHRAVLAPHLLRPPPPLLRPEQVSSIQNN